MASRPAAGEGSLHVDAAAVACGLADGTNSDILHPVGGALDRVAKHHSGEVVKAPVRGLQRQVDREVISPVASDVEVQVVLDGAMCSERDPQGVHDGGLARVVLAEQHRQLRIELEAQLLHRPEPDEPEGVDPQVGTATVRRGLVLFHGHVSSMAGPR